MARALEQGWSVIRLDQEGVLHNQFDWWAELKEAIANVRPSYVIILGKHARSLYAEHSELLGHAIENAPKNPKFWKEFFERHNE